MDTEENYQFHEPVLKDEVINNIVTDKTGIYLDGTLGGGGLSFAILDNLEKDGFLVCIDIDDEAIKFSKKKLERFSNKVILKENYANLESVCRKTGISRFSGMIIDLGLSFFQISQKNRGFAYMENVPLDMRMNQSDSVTAEAILNNYSKQRLADIFFHLGEERRSRKIAELIVNMRKKERITNSRQLVDIIKKVTPEQKWIKTAARIFQALRIEVNQEMQNLKKFLSSFTDYLSEGGRIGIISYHSIEDRIVKNSFKKYSGVCICPKESPVCRCKKVKKLEIITKKPVTPNTKEIQRNPKSRSAKFRIAERCKQ